MSTFGCILLTDYLLKYSRESRQKCFLFLGVWPAIKSSQNPKKQIFFFFFFWLLLPNAIRLNQLKILIHNCHEMPQPERQRNNAVRSCYNRIQYTSNC